MCYECDVFLYNDGLIKLLYVGGLNKWCCFINVVIFW